MQLAYRSVNSAPDIAASTVGGGAAGETLLPAFFAGLWYLLPDKHGKGAEAI